MHDPRVSVLMTVYNGERYLDDAVRSLLAQTFTDFELVIVDDASTDGTAAILARYAAADPRVRVVRNETNLNQTVSLNKALALARGEFAARQDADDCSHPDRLRLQVDFLRRNPEVVLVGTDARMIDESGGVLWKHDLYRARTPLGARWQTLFGNPFIHSAVMFRKAIVVERFGGYDERDPYNQDFELWSRITIEAAACNLPDVLVDYRVHKGSMTNARSAAPLARWIENLDRNIGYQRRNVMAILHDERLADQWPPLWSAINIEWLRKPEEPRRLFAAIDRLYQRFVEIHPEARASADVHAVQRSVLLRLARYFLKRDPLAALRAGSRLALTYIGTSGT